MAHGQIQQPSFYSLRGGKVLSSAAGAKHQNWEKAPIPSPSPPAAPPPDGELLKNKAPTSNCDAHSIQPRITRLCPRGRQTSSLRLCQLPLSSELSQKALTRRTLAFLHLLDMFFSFRPHYLLFTRPTCLVQLSDLRPSSSLLRAIVLSFPRNMHEDYMKHTMADTQVD